jgi:hypothetical protein
LAIHKQRMVKRGEMLVSELPVKASVEVEEQAVKMYLADCILLSRAQACEVFWQGWYY